MSDSKRSTIAAIASVAPFRLGSASIDWVSDTFESLTLREKLGQIFMQPLVVPDPRFIERANAVAEPAGYMLRPMPGGQARQLASQASGSATIPPFIAANLDRGANGIAAEGTCFASSLAIGATASVVHAERAGLVAGREASSYGLNLSFGPVVDIDLNDANPITNVRTFGSDPVKVAGMSRSYITALQSTGVAACAKHWPGDGVDDRDQHLVTSVNSLSTSEWDDSYGLVWREVIDSGVLSIMAGHISLPAYSAELAGKAYHEALPATLAPEILTTLLRDRLGFNGLIASDATMMGGFMIPMPRHEAIPQAVMAGCDIILFSADYAADVQSLTDALEAGSLSQERLDLAVIRVLALKAALGLDSPSAPSIVDDADKAANEQWARECADDAVTLVKDLDSTIPLTVERHRRVLIYPLDSQGESSKAPERIAAHLRDAGFDPTVFAYSETMDFMKILAGEDVVSRARLLDEFDVVLYVAAIPNRSNQPTVRLNWAPFTAGNLPLYLSEIPTVFVSMENPYHLRDVPRIRTFINAYQDSEDAAAAVAAKLIGADSFRGTSPVDPFCGYPEAAF